MIFVDAMYLNVFANWLSFYRAACSDDTSLLELICMDNLSHRGLERLQLSCSERSFKLIFDKKKSIFDGKLTNIWCGSYFPLIKNLLNEELCSN